MSYPETPGYSNLTTSKAAAEKVDHLTQSEMVLNFIKGRGAYGATLFEVAEELGLLIRSAGGRFTDLFNAGKIIDAGFERINQYGNMCIVRVVAPEGTLPTIRHKTYKELLEENEQLRRHYNLCTCPFKGVIRL